MSKYGEFNQGLVTDVAATAEELGGQVGSQRTEKSTDAFGDKQYTLVKHLLAVTVVVGHVAAIKVATAPYEVTNDASGDIGLGVGVYVSIPAENEFCWIQTGGYTATLLTGGSVSALDALGVSGTDGESVTVVTTTTATPPPWFARALADDTSTNVEAIIVSPYGAPSQ